MYFESDYNFNAGQIGGLTKFGDKKDAFSRRKNGGNDNKRFCLLYQPNTEIGNFAKLNIGEKKLDFKIFET